MNNFKMNMSLGSRLKNAWNVFLNKDTTVYKDLGASYSYRPDRPRLTRGTERTIVNSICNRIALDVAAITFKHVKLDDNGRFMEEVDSGLNTCLTLEANVDQSAFDFIHDIVISMLDEGCVAVVPVDTDPRNTMPFSIETMRVGKIVNWYPQHVMVNLYDERTGRKQDVRLSKRFVSIIQNPFYAVMNEPNSTMQRLVRKLAMLDVIDEKNSSGKLDLILQLPYTVRTDTRREQAEHRRSDIEKQLVGSKYGIAYVDATERITQLNRPIENNLMSQIEYLTSMLFSQLGMTQGILDGTADEKTMLNYDNRIISVIAQVITNEFIRKFLTQTARSRHHSVMAFRDPFKLVPVSQIAEIADKFTRNEIMSSNEIRQVVGLKPSSDPNADELRNKNLNQSGAEQIPDFSEAIEDEQEE